MTGTITSGFHTTHWSLIQAASVDSKGPTGNSRRSLSTLCQRYYHPVYAFIRRNSYDLDQVPVSIDRVETERRYVPLVVEEATPETLFKCRWTLSILDQVLAMLRAEFAAQMGMSAGVLRMSVHRMRLKYRRLLREEIAETVSTPSEMDDEIRFLMSARST